MGLPSQLACSACKTVCAVYNAEMTQKQRNFAIFKKPVVPVIWKHGLNRTRKGVTLWGELITFDDPRPLPTGKWKDSKIKRVNGQWYLLLCYEVEIPEPKNEGCIVGVDMGIKRMLVATNSENSKTFFYHGGALNHRRSCIRRVRAQVQSVGSRSARRLLRRQSGHEAAVTGHLLHDASKALVRYAVGVRARKIVVENLSNIRDASLKKGKNLRSKVHRWPYADMKFKIAYKAAAVGIGLESVSPHNTSRGCPCCGHVSKNNRHGLHFECEKCHYKGDSDRVGSVNIRLRSVSREHNSLETGRRRAPKSNGTVDIGSGSCVSHGDLVPV